MNCVSQEWEGAESIPVFHNRVGAGARMKKVNTLIHMNKSVVSLHDGYFAERLRIAQREFLRCQKVLEKMRSKRYAFGLLTAVKLLMIEVPRDCTLSDSFVYVCVREHGARTTVSGVAAHVSSAPMTVVVLEDGTGASLRVTDAVTTCMQMAAYCSREETTVLFDFLTRRGTQKRYLYENDLERYLVDSPQFKGKTCARWAWAHHRMNTDSSMETRLRLLLDNARLPSPRVNLIFRGDKATDTWYVDLVYPELGIILEYQGEEWHTGKDRLRKDSKRSERLQQYGCLVIPVTSDRVLTASGRAELLESIKTLLKMRRRSLSKRRKTSFASRFYEQPWEMTDSCNSEGILA